MKVTLVVDVSDLEEVAAVERWRETWGERLQFIADNQGCGCCVDIWEVEAPEEAVIMLPQSVISSGASNRPRHHRSLRERIMKRMWAARGCLISLMLLGTSMALLMLAAVHMIPYQDPTPELRAQYARDVETARTLALFGVTALGCGVLASGVVGYRWVRHRLAERRGLR